MTQRIVDASEIGAPDPSAIPRIRPPERANVFRARAARLRQLADRGNAVADYLRLMALLADAQQRGLDDSGVDMLPREQIERAQRESLPLVPLATGLHERAPAWRRAFDTLLDRLQASLPPDSPLDALFTRLRAQDDATLAAQADAIAGERLTEIDPAVAPFLIAALQVVWTGIAAGIAPRDVPYVAQPGHCPVCDSPPVAGVVRVGGPYDSYRYLQCGLCSTEWHVVRIKCSNCDSTRGIAYHVAGAPEADSAAREAEAKTALLKAESCDECHTYRKIGYQQRDYDFEPFADDLASLTLDLLMGEAGYRRASPHPWLWPEPVDGEAEQGDIHH